MGQAGINVRDGRAEFIGDDGQHATATPKDVRRLDLVSFSEPLFHGEEPFYLLHLQNYAWIVPYFTPGIGDLLQLLRPRLESEALIYLAECARLPLRLRRRLMGWLPLFPSPRLARYDASALPSWPRNGPFRLSEVPDLLDEMDNGQR